MKRPSAARCFAHMASGAVTLTFLVPALIFVSGCKDKPEGPKRTDNEAAHMPHYHPDVPRATITGSRPAEATASRPAATQFADLFEAGVVGSPVLFVNNQTVTIPEILEPLIEGFRRQSKVLTDSDYTDTVLRDIRNQIDYQVSTLLVYQQAKSKYEEKKVQEAFDHHIDQMIKDLVNEQYGGVYARYEAHLKSLDYTPAEAKDRLKRELIVRDYLRERFKPMLQDPTRQELMHYYEEHLPDFTTSEKAELFLIEAPFNTLLDKPLEQASEDELAAARAKARANIKRAREEIESGVEFAAVAKKYSSGASARKGGAWGEISRGSLAGRMAKPGEALFTLASNEMKDVETDDAVFLVRCGKKTPPHRASFEETQRAVIDKLVDEQFNRLRGDYIRDLIKNATINKRPEFTQALLAVVPRPMPPGEKDTSSLKSGR